MYVSCMYVCVCMYVMYVCMYVRTCVCMYVYIYVYVFMYVCIMYVRMYVWRYVCMCVYICMYVYMYVCMCRWVGMCERMCIFSKYLFVIRLVPQISPSTKTQQKVFQYLDIVSLHSRGAIPLRNVSCRSKPTTTRHIKTLYQVTSHSFKKCSLQV